MVECEVHINQTLTLTKGALRLRSILYPSPSSSDHNLLASSSIRPSISRILYEFLHRPYIGGRRGSQASGSAKSAICEYRELEAIQSSAFAC